ncbi:MAG: glucan biosynthesis protein G [Pseudomonadota bacterium]
MISRRALLAGMAATAATPAFANATLVTAETPFSIDMVHTMAKELAQTEYVARPLIPQAWRDLTYDEFKHIWFDTDNAIWENEDRPMKLDLFTAGLYQQRPVEVNFVESGVAKTLAYNLDIFATTDMFPEMPVDETMGYSGVRMRSELTEPGKFTEFFVFQGASYFRGLANGQDYGLSARGLALRTGDPNGEEFPDFTHFWVEAAKPGDTEYVVHALLNGPSTTGAYSFYVSHGAPGEPTLVDVEATLYPRVDLMHVGIGPLTSMFFFDETNRIRFDDFRPAVHDSEGLMVWNGNGEKLWRPLANPTRVQVSSFVDENPQGFGLLQRTRRAEDYADLQANYHNRPSLWITPGEGWGRGTVELVEIPADKEIYDNIVAYWRPAEPIPAGSDYSFTYKMEWGDEPEDVPDVARVTNTRIGKGFDQIKNVVAIDFTDHPMLPEDLSEVTLTVRSNTGEISEGILQRNPGTGGVRLAFSFLPGDAQAVEMRAQMHMNSVPVSEVWLYRWTI